jgi:hypothetical protein
MTVNDLVHRLEGNERYEYRIEQNGSVTITDTQVVVAADSDVHPVTNFSEEALSGIDWSQVRASAAQGHDVDHITRITGYFSKTSSWNRGKQGELKDRHKTGMIERGPS